MSENTQQKSPASRRKLKNYLYNARLSKRYHVYALVSLGAIALFEAYAIRMLRNVAHTLSTATEVPVAIQDSMFSSLINASLLFFAIFLFHALLTVLFILFIEEKVGGASVAILASIEELKKGNYNYRRKLRDRDELQTIMTSLHELSDILRAKESKDK